jgi:hypothetical protein
MDSDQVYVILNKKKFEELFKTWKEQNPDVIHPTTKFFEQLGLQYRQTNRDGNYRTIIEDKQKYFLSKINYGI